MIASLPARSLLALAATCAPVPDRRGAGGTTTGIVPALACLLAGEGLAALLGLPVPGPVLGLGLLLAGMGARRDAARAGPVSARIGRWPRLALLLMTVGLGIVVRADLAEPDPPTAIAAVLGAIVLGRGARRYAIEGLKRRMRPAVRVFGP